MSTTANEIANYIPAKYRKVLYTVLFVAGVLLGATTVGFVAAVGSVPKAVLVVTAVYGYLCTASNYVAKANTPTETPQDAI